MSEKKSQPKKIKNQIGKQVEIRLAMELPKKPEKPVVSGNNTNSNNK